MFLGEIPNAGANGGRQRPAVASQQAGLAPVGREQTEEHANRRAFARAVSSEEGKHAAAGHGEVEAVHGALGANIFREIPRVNHRLIAHQLSPFSFFHWLNFRSKASVNSSGEKSMARASLIKVLSSGSRRRRLSVE